MRVKSVVFLDVDGVLNTEKTCVHTPSGFIGVDESRIEILSKAMKEIGTNGVVLTATWKEMQEDEEDYAYLMEKLERFGIGALGKTKEKNFTQREEGILEYLQLHPEIEEFVILDDQQFGFRNSVKLWEGFIDTQGRGIEYGIAASKTPSVSVLLFLDAIRECAK